MKTLCICEICNCGRHRCAHKPTAIYEKGNASACVLTEYVDKFPVYGIYNPPQSMKPKQNLDHAKNKVPMDGVTTFKTDFIPHEITRRPHRQQTEYKPNSAKIDLETTYNQHFNPHDIQPFAPVKPRERTGVMSMKGKLDTIPTYKDDFRQWETCRREMNKPDHIYQTPSDKFGGTTTFQDDFTPRIVAPRESFKPSNAVKPSEVPFDGVTSNQLSFIPHPIESRYIRPPDMYKPSSEPLLDLTTHRQDFQGLRGEPPQSCKPCPNKNSVNTPFQGSTENRDNFKVWPVSLPQLHKTDEYVSPMEHMDLSTTTAADYVRHQIQPFISARPYLTPKRSSAPFQNCTTMREDFQPWLAHTRRPLVKMHDEMYKASGKMEDLTTSRAHYTPHELRPNISFKPTNQPMRASVPMEGFTMYRTAFTPKRVNVCPASYESPPGYVFQEADERGHKYFRKLSSKDSNQNHVDRVVPMQKEVAVL